MKVKTIFIILIIALIPTIVGLIYYDLLPEILPTHFDFSGTVDSTMNKNLVIFGAPVLSLGISSVTLFMMNTDPKKDNYAYKIKRVIPYFVPIIISAFTCFSYYISLGYSLKINQLVSFILAITLMFLGNYMPKTRQNYTMGIRTQWALHDSDNWRKTHRFAGYVYFTFGIILFILALFDLNINFIPMLIVLAVVLPWGYSYVMYYQKEKKNVRN